MLRVGGGTATGQALSRDVRTVGKRIRPTRMLSLAGFLALWFLAAALNERLQLVNVNYLPRPTALLTAAADQWADGTLLADLAASLRTAFLGYLIGCSIGVILGMLAGYLRVVDSVIDPVIQLLRPIPPLAFLPMFIIYLGIGDTARILFIAYACFFYVYLNTAQGVKYTDPLLIRAACCLGANQAQIFLHVILRWAVPDILTGLRVSAGMSLFVLVAAEMIAANNGLGYRIMWARQYFAIDTMLLDAFLIGILGFLIDTGMRGLESRLLHWRAKVEQ